MDYEIYYSASLNGFTPAQWKDDGTYTEETWPTDSVLLTEDEVQTYQQGNPPAGKMLGSEKGRPAWVDLPELTAEEKQAQSQARKDSLMADATTAIAPLQDAVDLDMATDEEMALLKKWKTYRVLLNRIDTSEKEISWPEMPSQ